MASILAGDGDAFVPKATSIITPQQYNCNIPEHGKTINYLPTLAFELQFAILCQIPPVQLFTLRRVSRAWSHMLQNPVLLEGINNQLPYLTSASDLTSRMKRRMRMVHKKPVWVKPITELFPWTQRIVLQSDWYGVEQIMKFWDGWVVIMDRSKELGEMDFTSTIPNPVIKFRIEGLGKKARKDAPVVEVDVLADFKRTYPLDYPKYFEEDHDEVYSNIKIMRFQFREFSIQDGKVVVVLAGELGNSDHLRSSLWRGMMALGGDFDNPSLGEGVGREGRQGRVYWIFIHSLHDGSLVQQLRISYPDPTQHDDYIHDSLVSSFHLRQYQFDHQGRVWIIYFEPVLVSYFGTDDLAGPMVSPKTISLNELPRFMFRGLTWVIVPTLPAGHEREPCRTTNVNRRIKDQYANGDHLTDAIAWWTELGRYSGIRWTDIGIHAGRLCTLDIQTKRIPDPKWSPDSQQKLAKIPVINRYPNQRKANNVDVKVYPKRSDNSFLTELNILTFRTASRLLNHNFQHGNVNIDLEFSPKVISRSYMILDHAEQLTEGPSQIMWGFVGKHLTNLCKYSGAETRGFLDLYILPFHHNDMDYFDPGPSKERTKAKHTPLLYRNPHATPTFSSASSSEDLELGDHDDDIDRQSAAYSNPEAPSATDPASVMKPAPEPRLRGLCYHTDSADDGLVSLTATILEEGILRDEYWFVCYEEEWAM